MREVRKFLAAGAGLYAFWQLLTLIDYLIPNG